MLLTLSGISQIILWLISKYNIKHWDKPSSQLCTKNAKIKTIIKNCCQCLLIVAALWHHSHVGFIYLKNEGLRMCDITFDTWLSAQAGHFQIILTPELLNSAILFNNCVVLLRYHNSGLITCTKKTIILPEVDQLTLHTLHTATLQVWYIPCVQSSKRGKVSLIKLEKILIS